MKIELSSPRFPSTIYHNFIVPKYYYSLLSYSLRRVYFFYSNLSTRPYHARIPPLDFSYLIIISFLSYPSATFCVEHFAKIDAGYFRHVPSTGYVYKKSITANIRFLTWKRRINLSIKLQRFEISDRDKKIKRKERKLPSYPYTLSSTVERTVVSQRFLFFIFFFLFSRPLENSTAS